MTTTMETSGSLFGGSGVRECNKVVKSFFSSFSSRASSSSSRIRCRRVFFLVVFAASFLSLLLFFGFFFYREEGERVGTFNENNGFSFDDERMATPRVEYLSEMIDGNEDELEGGGRTAFEMMKQTTKEDDDEDAFNDDEEKMNSTSEAEQLLSSSCASSEEEEHGAGSITKATKTRQAWAFKASSSLQYAHMPTHATHGSMVLLAFQGAKRSEGQANQRIYLVRSEDGGKTFDSSNAKKLNALVVEGGRSSFSGEKEDAKVEAQWGPALFKEEEEESVGGKKDKKKKIPLLRLYYSQSESCFFCRHRNTCGSDAKEYRAGGNLYETTSKDFGKTWSKPKLILKEKEKDPTKGGHSPKVVASPPIRTKLGGAEKNATSASSHLLLPYWTQKPRVGANGIKSACASEMNAKDGPRTLHSKDNGKSWHPLGTRAVRHEDAHRKAPEIDRLLEGAIVSSNSKIVQFFRATRPRVYASLFDEKKTEWGKPFPVRASTPSKHHNNQQHHHHHHRDDFLKMPNAKLHAISVPHQTQILLAHNDHPYRVRQRGNLVVQISDGVNPDGNGLAPFRKLLDVETARGRKEGEMVTYPHMEIVASPCPRRLRSKNNYELTLSYSDHGRGIRFVRAKLE